MIKILHLKGINDCLISFVIAFFCLTSFNAFSANDRIALIIGNSKYQNLGTLNNTINDAKAVEKSLKEMGYKTRLVTDTNEIQIRKEIKSFALDSEKASLALIFYAGHGAQVFGENYILPTDLEIPQRESDIQLSGVKVDDIINSIRSKTKVVFLDACRDNPALIKSLSKGRGSYQSGLAPTKNSSMSESNTSIFIAYSTDSGNIALDGNGLLNSPFTSSLIEYIKEPISIDDMFSKVTRDVKNKTNNTQKPYKYASLDGVVCLTRVCGSSPKIITNIELGNINAEISPIESQIDKKNIQLAMIDSLNPENRKDINKSELENFKKSLQSFLPNDWIIFNFDLDNNFWSIKPSSLKMIKNLAIGDIKKVSIKNNTSSIYSYAINCDSFKAGVYEEQTLDPSGRVLIDNKYSEPEFLELKDDFSDPNSLGFSGATLACNPVKLIPLALELNSPEWYRLYTYAGENADLYYLPSSVSINNINNTVLALVKETWRTPQKLSQNLPFAKLKDKDEKIFRWVSRVNLAKINCNANTYQYIQENIFDVNGKYTAIAGYNEKDATRKNSLWDITPNSASDIMKRKFCK